MQSAKRVVDELRGGKSFFFTNTDRFLVHIKNLVNINKKCWSQNLKLGPNVFLVEQNVRELKKLDDCLQSGRNVNANLTNANSWKGINNRHFVSTCRE